MYPLQLHARGQSLQYQSVVPFVVGVIKDLLVAPIGSKGEVISQGVAAVEPGAQLKKLMMGVRVDLQQKGFRIENNAAR